MSPEQFKAKQDRLVALKDKAEELNVEARRAAAVANEAADTVRKLTAEKRIVLEEIVRTKQEVDAYIARFREEAEAQAKAAAEKAAADKAALAEQKKEEAGEAARTAAEQAAATAAADRAALVEEITKSVLAGLKASGGASA